MFFHKNNDDERSSQGTSNARVVPLLPLRDIIVFPHMVVTLFVGREKSINALEEAMGHEKEILLAAQRKAKTNDPAPEDIYEIGTVGVIIQLLRLPDGTVKVLVEGKRRARIERFVPNEEFLLCEVGLIEEPAVDPVAVEIEAERLPLALAQGQRRGALGGILEPDQLGQLERAVGRLDVAQHAAGADRGELLVVTDQADAAAALEDVRDRGVQGEGVGHARLVDHDER